MCQKRLSGKDPFGSSVDHEVANKPSRIHTYDIKMKEYLLPLGPESFVSAFDNYKYND
jgi:hypothetical protein